MKVVSTIRGQQIPKHAHFSQGDDTSTSISAAIWGKEWKGKRVLIRCDNTAVVSSINSRYCKDPLLMQLLRCLFFLEAQYQFKLKAEHITGVHNVLADNLSRDNLVSFRQLKSVANATPSDIPSSVLQWLLHPTSTGPHQPGWNCYFFCQYRIANSTQKTYKSALRRLANFCEMFNVLSPFPVSEAIMCHFASFLANYKLSPQTIKTYLAGIHHMQITLGLPEPRGFSSLPRLRLVQAGIQQAHAQLATAPTRICLPFTPTVLQQM